MIIEDLFENTIYPNLKQYVENTSIYSPLVTKKKPQESKKFPIVPVKLLPTTNTFTTVNYDNETYSFGINIDVYAIDTIIDGKEISKRTICNEITDVIVNYFKSNLRVTIKTELE